MAETTVYIDGTTLANSTGAWTDENLTTCAPEGFYSDANIGGDTVRFLTVVNGICTFTSSEPCP